VGFSLLKAFKAAAAGFVAGGPVGAAAAWATEAGKQVYATEQEKAAARVKREADIRLHPEHDTTKPGYIDPAGNVLVATQWENIFGASMFGGPGASFDNRAFVRYWVTAAGPLRTYSGSPGKVPAGATWANGEIRQPFRPEDAGRYMAAKSEARKLWDAASSKVVDTVKAKAKAALDAAMGKATGTPKDATGAVRPMVTADVGDLVALHGEVRLTTRDPAGNETGYSNSEFLSVARVKALLGAYDAQLGVALRTIEELRQGPPVEEGPPEPAAGAPAAKPGMGGAILTSILAIGAVALPFFLK
jgi:hypothetical protein